MYQWRKFEFFEEKYGGKCKVPEEITSEILCCSSGRGKIALGCHDGIVCLLDRGFKFNYAFPAHSSSVLFLQHLKQRNFLLTVGEDEVLPQASAMCLKLFDLDKTQVEGSSTSAPIPDCIITLRIFTNTYIEAKITSFLVLEDAPPMLMVAIGLENGSIYCIKGDIAREKISRFTLNVENASAGNASVTGLGFRNDGTALQLFAVTPSSISVFNFNFKPVRRQTLDQIGCLSKSVAMTDRLVC